MSNGRLDIKVYGAGELVGAFEVFDAVSQGTAEMGHGAAYYWRGKIPVAAMFSTVPFGMNAQEMNGWLHYGGGMELWRELYAPFGLVPFACGNSGVQMAGWFNREINSLADLQGLKMRIPGLGGEVLKRAGGVPVSLPGSEVFTALQTGAIDATEWVGPYNDLALGLYSAARYYYYPGWHEPGPTLEAIVNKEAWESLPLDLQAMVEAATRMINEDMLSEFTARNNAALRTLVDEHAVELRKLPDDVVARLRDLSTQVVAEMAESDPLAEAHLRFLHGTLRPGFAIITASPSRPTWRPVRLLHRYGHGTQSNGSGDERRHCHHLAQAPSSSERLDRADAYRVPLVSGRGRRRGRRACHCHHRRRTRFLCGRRYRSACRACEERRLRPGDPCRNVVSRALGRMRFSMPALLITSV